MFEVLRLALQQAGLGLEIDAERLTDVQGGTHLADVGRSYLLVLDANLPGVVDLVSEGHTAPILAITQGALPELELECNPERRAIALPLDKLQVHGARVLKPFMAMLMDSTDGSAAAPPADKTSGAFRVIEVEFDKNHSTCRLGCDDSRASSSSGRGTETCESCETPPARSSTWRPTASVAG